MNEYSWTDSELSEASGYLLPALEKILQGLPASAVVADLGCGNGSILAQFRARGWELHGVEMSRSGLGEAAKSYPGITFCYADLTTDLTAHPLAGRCDAIISTEVVEHLFLPRIYARNCFALLKPGGILAVSTPYHGYLKNIALATSGSLERHFTALLDFGHIKFWSRRTLTTLLEEAGFRVQRFIGTGRIAFLWKSMIIVARKPESSGPDISNNGVGDTKILCAEAS